MKFTCKTITAVCLTACLLFSGNAYAISATEPEAETEVVPVTSAASESAEEFLSSSAIVKEIISMENGYRITVSLKYESQQDIALNISEETLVIDNETGLSANVSDIKVGDEVVAYYSQMMTRSLPPQSNCAALVTNIIGNNTQAKYMSVGEIEILSDGGIKAYNADGSYILTIAKEASVISAADGTELTIEDIQEGSRIFSWFDIMLMSYPGQASTDRVSVVLPAAAEEDDDTAGTAVILPVTEFDKIIINGEEVDLSELPIYMVDDIAMIPLRLVAEKLGFTVTWNDKDYSIDLDDAEVNTTLIVGEDLYYKASSVSVGLTAPMSLGAAPELVDDRTFIPAALFNLLYSNPDSVTVIDGVLTITK